MITIRSSSLPRLMVCNGALNFIDLPHPESDAAKEGTAFHELVETRFRNLPVPEKAKNDWVFDADMFYYAGQVLKLIPANAICEQELIVPIVREHMQVVGHLDYAWEEDNGNTLVIMDIKYGHRIVDVNKNWQLLSYAMGELIKRQREYNAIKIMIVQPRPYHLDGPVRTATYTTAEIYNAYYELRVQLTAERSFLTSDKCKYCPGSLGKCAALNTAFYNSVDVVMSDNMGGDLSPEQISSMLKTYDRVKDILKIKVDGLTHYAEERIAAGVAIPGYGIQKQYGHRVWTKNFDAVAIEKMTKVKVQKIVTLSPAELEKQGMDESLIEAFTEKPYKGTKLVPVDQVKLADKIFGK